MTGITPGLFTSRLSWKNNNKIPGTAASASTNILSQTQASKDHHHSCYLEMSTYRYWCTSCDKAFKHRQDWLAHEDRRHAKWRIYSCPSCSAVSSFTNLHHHQALRCSHCSFTAPALRFVKPRTGWACGFCSAFHTHPEGHFRHVTEEYERHGKTKAHWNHSNVIYGLLCRPGIREYWKMILSESTQFPRGVKPFFSWNDTHTARAPGFLNGLCRGNLQDRLEFFDHRTDDGLALARLAFEQADKMSFPRHYVSGNVPSLGDHRMPSLLLPPPRTSRMSFPSFNHMIGRSSIVNNLRERRTMSTIVRHIAMATSISSRRASVISEERPVLADIQGGATSFEDDSREPSLYSAARCDSNTLPSPMASTTTIIRGPSELPDAYSFPMPPVRRVS